MNNRESMGLRLRNGELSILDQTRLPGEELWLRIDTVDDMIEAIGSLRVRGAPLIGVAAALSLARMAEAGAGEGELAEAGMRLRAARPTAVNLMAAVDRLMPGGKVLEREVSMREAEAIFDEDAARCESIARHGTPLIEDGDRILTHCNSGALATAGVGTALGVIRRAHERGKRIHVLVDETRPLLQGARLTAWELGKLGIAHTLIGDGMAAAMMALGEIDKILVGADRIARNGDFANKIGTYSLAVLAHYHEIPFYVAAPTSTIDWNCSKGGEIPIEERGAEELRGFGGLRWSPPGTPVRNPAFDVTPVALLTGLVLETGLLPGDALAVGGLEAFLRPTTRS